eukprot:554060-Pyramimonas_sp.AAC.1
MRAQPREHSGYTNMWQLHLHAAALELNLHGLVVLGANGGEQAHAGVVVQPTRDSEPVQRAGRSSNTGGQRGSQKHSVE